jgi:hypothetical protein
MPDPSIIIAFATLGLGGGIVLFVRGLVAYRRDRLISSVATSRLDGLAAGEVRVSGVVRALDQQLTSPLQSRPCVWYRARIETKDDSERVLFSEERAVHFAVDDEHGSIRVVPAGARWEVGTAFDEASSLIDGEPAGLHRRDGASYASVLPDDPSEMTETQRRAAIEALLTVQPSIPDERLGAASGLVGVNANSGRRYREARLEVGETITVLGQAMPWSDVEEKLLARRDDNIERSIADDLAVARAAGTLAGSPEEAWGNAAIPGFGIGQPTRPPELDPDARPLGTEAVDPDAHRAALARFDIPGHELVLAGTLDRRLAIYAGVPQAAMQRHDQAFLLGLVGAVVAVVSTLALGAALGGSL